MKILVENRLIDTQQIADIYDVEKHKKMFLNREAGFIIVMLDGTKHKFTESIDYDSYPHEISEKKRKWEKLFDAVCAQWQSDKTSIPTFKL